MIDWNIIGKICTALCSHCEFRMSFPIPWLWIWSHFLLWQYNMKRCEASGDFKSIYGLTGLQCTCHSFALKRHSPPLASGPRRTQRHMKQTWIQPTALSWMQPTQSLKQNHSSYPLDLWARKKQTTITICHWALGVVCYTALLYQELTNTYPEVFISCVYLHILKAKNSA